MSQTSSRRIKSNQSSLLHKIQGEQNRCNNFKYRCKPKRNAKSFAVECQPKNSICHQALQRRKQSFRRVQGCTRNHSSFLHEKERTQKVTPSQPDQTDETTSTETIAPAINSAGEGQSKGLRTTYKVLTCAFLVHVSE